VYLPHQGPRHAPTATRWAPPRPGHATGMSPRRRGPSICAEPGCSRLTLGARCDEHDLGYTPAERRRMATTVASHRAAHGDWCPGWECPPHPAADLTADHVVPIAHGGLGGPLTVLCRSCNSRRGSTIV
jgi:5-methylcytosine-specific restriction protein A